MSFNGTVQNWAAKNGVNVAVMRDRAVIDKVTRETCPEVRESAIQALQVPDLATALIGF
ncbi:hypothetical protein AB0N05_07625 [Nocardia sp. NPDC051030]|uniref:hypothetical protein n=1 Tax=Nocardia sp. NPDC051030 TaxID=3155162 RepID=UPI00343EEB75